MGGDHDSIKVTLLRLKFEKLRDNINSVARIRADTCRHATVQNNWNTQGLQFVVGVRWCGGERHGKIGAGANMGVSLRW